MASLAIRRPGINKLPGNTESDVAQSFYVPL